MRGGGGGGGGGGTPTSPPPLIPSVCVYLSHTPHFRLATRRSSACTRLHFQAGNRPEKYFAASTAKRVSRTISRIDARSSPFLSSQQYRCCSPVRSEMAFPKRRSTSTRWTKRSLPSSKRFNVMRHWFGTPLLEDYRQRNRACKSCSSAAPENEWAMVCQLDQLVHKRFFFLLLDGRYTEGPVCKMDVAVSSSSSLLP